MSAIETNFRSFSAEGFAREYLGIWPAGGANALINPVNWDLCRLDGALPALPAAWSLAIAVDHEGRCATIAGAFKDADGLIHALIIDHRTGTAWTAKRAGELSRKYRTPIVFDGRSATNGVVTEALSRMNPRPKLEPKTWPEVSTGAAGLLSLINDAKLRHYAQPELNAAVQGARKRNVKDGSDALRWSFGKLTVTDVITPLEAINLAVHAAQQAKVRRPMGRVTLQRS